MELNLTNEMLGLLKFTGGVATAIRMYSSYNPENQMFPWSQQDSDAILQLSDILHYFENFSYQMSIGIEERTPERIIIVCQNLMLTFTQIQEIMKNHKPFGPKAERFHERNLSLCDFEDAKLALNSIITKCEFLTATTLS